MPQQVVLITGAGSGFGALSARALAREGHIVYAGLCRAIAKQSCAAEKYASEHKVDLRYAEVNIREEAAVKAVCERIYEETGRGDFAIVHNAGHMTIGPVEAHTPEQLLELYDINVVGAHRLNRAALPYMRKARAGQLIWISSSSVSGRGGPFVIPYYAAKAGVDSLAYWSRLELSQFGIDTTIIVPGIFARGTAHIALGGRAADEAITKEYLEGPYKGFMKLIPKGAVDLISEDADPEFVGKAVVEAVNAPADKKPSRMSVDFADDGADVGCAVTDRNHKYFVERCGLGALYETKLQH